MFFQVGSLQEGFLVTTPSNTIDNITASVPIRILTRQTSIRPETTYEILLKKILVSIELMEKDATLVILMLYFM